MCPWDATLNKIVYENEKSRFIDNPCRAYDLLQKAKFDFKKISAEARITGSDKIFTALNKIESGFDDVFLKYVTDEYYLRSLADYYNEIMSKRFIELEEIIRSEIKV